jgi:hypothetical protein
MGLALPGCHPGGFAANDVVVVTFQDPARNFDAYDTFAFPEPVFDLSDTAFAPLPHDATHDARLRSGFVRGLANYGWQRPRDPESTSVDATLLIGVVTSNNFVWIGSPSFDYYPGWGLIFPGGWTPANVSSGTVIAVLVKADEYDPNVHAIPVLWAALLQNLITPDSPQADAGAEALARAGLRLDQALAQAFAQSPYLETGPRVSPDQIDSNDAGNATDGGVE